MADSYAGPATLTTEDGGIEITLTVELRTNDSDGTYSWDGPGRSHDLRALNVEGGTLTLPDGRHGPVRVAATEMKSKEPGVLVHLHGGGPAPY